MRLSILHTIRSVPPIWTWSPGVQTVLAGVLCSAALDATAVATASATEVSEAVEAPISLALAL
jgi:hypothetical protein